MGKDIKKNNQPKIPFAERHPKLNILLGLFLLLFIAALIIGSVYLVVKLIGNGLNSFTTWLSELSSKMDAVVIVALITGMVSLVGVVISSVVAKSLEYKKARNEYLAHKREKAYGEFVNMVYKIQQNGKKPGTYSEEEMLKDLYSFSQEITLWGSSAVVNKWVKFRENGLNPQAAYENLFVMEDIMNEMRKDMGLKKVQKGNLLAFFVNDIKQTMKNGRK